MQIQQNKMQIRYINKDDLVFFKNDLIYLLADNIAINFPNKINQNEFAIKSYHEMVKFYDDGSAIIIGVFEYEKLFGFIWAYKKIFFGERRVHISHIIVKEEGRGKGLGSKLLHYFEKEVVRMGIHQIELLTSCNNINTIAFYKSKGFNKTRIQLEKYLNDYEN